MSRVHTLEVVVSTSDDGVVREVEECLTQANPQRWKQTRDFTTVIAVSASTLSLVKAILDLKAHFSKKKDRPHIVINNVDRRSIMLTEITEDKVKSLLKEDTEK